MNPALHPGNVIAWLAVGLLAGAIAGRVTRGRGYGCIGDILLGLAGAFVGGLVVSPFIHGTAHFLGTLAVALIGAVAVLLLVRVLAKAV
jgi:uncharacterized membrane protein YeaQ/YmgE (transglycosylase-associated protein family)